MPFDMNAVLADPQFQVGLGLMGAASPRNRAMLDAYSILQQQAQQKQAAEQLKLKNDFQQQKYQSDLVNQQSEIDYRKAQSQHADAQSKLYERQVTTAEQNAANDQRKQQVLMDAVQAYQARRNGGQPAAPTMQPQSTQAPTSNVFGAADAFVSKVEGGYVANDGGKGPTFNGINQRANPEIDVKALSQDPNGMAKAAEIRKQKYWNALQLDNQPPETAAVAYDAAINQGQQYAKNLLEKTGGNPELMLQQRRQDYRDLAKQPQHAANLKGWESRLNELQAQLKTQPAQPKAGGGDPFAQHRDDLEFAGTMRALTGDLGGLKDLADAGKPNTVSPGQVIYGPNGATTVPDPKGEASMRAEQQRLANEQTRLGFEQTRVGNEAERLKMAQAEEARNASKAARELAAGPHVNTEEGKATVYYTQMTDATKALDKLQSQGWDPTSAKNQTAVSMAGSAATNWMVGPQAQQARQAQEQWAEAYLRFKTGQATNASEIERNVKMFFPQLGDKVDNIKQKQGARLDAQRAMSAAVGQGVEKLKDKAAERTVVRTGKRADGTRVVQYSDGSIENAK